MTATAPSRPPLPARSRRFASAAAPAPALFSGCRRGQSITVDFIVSISIFMLLLAVAYSVWNTNVQRMGDQLLQGRAEDAARRGLASIIESPGYPTNWAALNITPDNSTLLGMGAASSYGVIDPYKLGRMAAIFNTTAQYNYTLLKMGLAPFQADVRVYYLNGTNISVMGAPPNASGVVQASGARLAQWMGNPVMVRVRVWTVTPT
ncbi:MAG: hypothetical protein KGH63_02445 [Candidatus Micrarchaeota archaeon]|nr:hypothetical protein [Candidatus Micrarchaeota archaeon]